MEAESLVRVVGLGLDTRFRSMLDIFFLRSCNGNYQLAEDAADVIVVDMDAVGARDAYVEHRQLNAEVPSILFSLHEEQYKTRGNTVLLRKPFTVRQLQSAFEIITIRFLNPLDVKVVTSAPRTKKALSTRTSSGSRPEKTGGMKNKKNQVEDEEVTTENPVTPLPSVSRKKGKTADTSRAAFSLARHDEYVKLNSLLPGMAGGHSKDQEQTYEPQYYLQNELKLAFEQARRAGKNAVIKLGSATITIDPKQELVRIGMGKFQLREVSSFPLNHNNFNLTLASEKEALVDLEGNSKVLRFRELVWQTTLYAAQGRIPERVDMEAPEQLRRWPNLTRLMLTSGAVRISALWVVQPASISEIATQLGLSLRDVASFYSAAHALDLFHSDKAITTVERTLAPGSRKDGVLKRILQRLRA